VGGACGGETAGWWAVSPQRMPLVLSSMPKRNHRQGLYMKRRQEGPWQKGEVRGSAHACSERRWRGSVHATAPATHTRAFFLLSSSCSPTPAHPAVALTVPPTTLPRRRGMLGFGSLSQFSRSESGLPTNCLGRNAQGMEKKTCVHHVPEL